MAFIAAILPLMIAHAAPPQECIAIPLPTADEIAPWQASGPYASALSRYPMRPREAGLGISRAWQKIRARLESAFATDKCDTTRIHQVLSKYTLAHPPLAVAGNDRFYPPVPVLMTAARAFCESGSVTTATRWLLDLALGGNHVASAATAVLWAASGRAQDALAILPDNPTDAAERAARAFALLKLGKQEEVDKLLSSIVTAPGSQTAAILQLITTHRDTSENLSGNH